MFDIAPTELLLVAFVALVVIGPKDLPKAMRVIGHWVGRARGMARHFRSGLDAMVREAELEEMEKTWAQENARIMREHPVDAQPAQAPDAIAPHADAISAAAAADFSPPTRADAAEPMLPLAAPAPAAASAPPPAGELP